jgi:hypothetical protein
MVTGTVTGRGNENGDTYSNTYNQEIPMQMFKNWIVDNNIMMKATPGTTEPTPPGVEGMDPWTVELEYSGRKMVLPFYMGKGHNGACPDTHEVLECVILDANGVDESVGFEDWASQYGYDPDSRKAERIYKECVTNAILVHGLLQDKFYEAVDLLQGDYQ